jgi:tRNA wybutosine-synthesizing protein 1
VRLTIYARGRRVKVSASPVPGSPVERKIELRPEWLPENTTFNASVLNVDNHAEDDIGAIAAVAKAKKGPKTFKGRKTPKKVPTVGPSFDHKTDKIQPLVFFQSLSGTTERYATQFAKILTEWTTGCDQSASFVEPQLHDISYLEFDDYFISPPKADAKHFYIILLPTYNIDTVLDNFLENLQETHNDFRIDTAPLRSLLGYSVFGFGDREGWPTEEEGFCSQAREVDRWMARLTGRKRGT